MANDLVTMRRYRIWNAAAVLFALDWREEERELTVEPAARVGAAYAGFKDCCAEGEGDGVWTGKLLTIRATPPFNLLHIAANTPLTSL